MLESAMPGKEEPFKPHASMDIIEVEVHRQQCLHRYSLKPSII
jgi:hypothetical protein